MTLGTDERRTSSGVRAAVRRARVRRAAYLVLLGNAAFAGVTAVGIPLTLDEAGLSKAGIAVFFIVNAGLGVAYNTGVVPRIRARGYPRPALQCTMAAVPVGALLIRFGGSTPLVLYLGGALLMFVTTTVPQVMGRVAAQSQGEAEESVVADLRQIFILGYVVGLVTYSVVALVGVDPMVTAAAIAGAAFLATFGTLFARPVLPAAHAGTDRSTDRRAALRVVSLPVLVAALVLMALMRSVDTLRSIYLPLFAASAGYESALIPTLFLASALLELLALPILSRMSLRVGTALTMAVVAGTAAVAFALLLLVDGYAALLGSQVLYAVFAAGFQSTGLVLLAKAMGSDVGAGASAYMAVMQVGTVLGAVLPLLVAGYSAAIFLIAVVLCVAGLCVALALHLSPALRR